jgi:hypothetical protein
MRWAISLSVLAFCTSGLAAAQAPLEVADAAVPPKKAVLTGAVESSELRSFGPWEVGAPAQAEALLPNTLWNNSDAVAIGALLDKISGVSFASPAANRLARSALLTPAAAAPAGSDAAAAEAARKRFAALGRYGAADEIVTMVSASPGAASDNAIAMFATQADLARGRNAEACRRSQNIPPATTATAAPDAFFLRMRAFCAAAAGDNAAAELAADVARTAGVNDPWLFSALLALAPDAKTKPPAKYDNSLDTAISLTGGFKPAAKPLVGSSLLAQGAVARSQNADPALRAESALAALRVNAISGAAGRAAFAAGANLKAAKGAPIPSAVVAVKTASAADDKPAAKALALESALAGMVNYPDYVAVARALAPEIAALPKDQTTAAAGLAMARAMLAIGDYKAAAEWRNLIVQSQAPTSEGARSALDAALVASGQGNIETAKVVLERRINLASGLSLRRASRDVAILTALGVPPPAPAAGFVNSNPVTPATQKADGAALAKAVDAAQRKAQGETAIYVAQAIAPGADKIEIDSLVSAIQALRNAGLMDAARAVAVEAMIAGGVA